MASTYSPNLRFELIGTGEQQGTWGTTTNTNIGTLIEEAISGYTSVTVSDGGDTTLTALDGASDQSRNMIINLTGTITASRNVICPAIDKLYIVKNATTGGYAVTFKVSGQTGVSIPNGQTVVIYVNSTDAVQATGNVANGGTGATSFTAYALVAGGTTSTGALQSVSGVGTSGQVLTSNGAGALPTWQSAAAFVPAGTKMLFQQTAAPTGWTKDTTHNNKALRVVSGAASSGGTVAFTTAFANQTISGTTGSTTATGNVSSTTATGTVGDTALTIDQIPAHTHGIGTGGASGTGIGTDVGNNETGIVTGSAGGGQTHTHTFTGTSHTHTFTGTSHTHTFSGSVDLAVQYVDLIIATKD